MGAAAYVGSWKPEIHNGPCMLDPSNDFWAVKVDATDNVSLFCRNDADLTIIQMMADLFMEQHPGLWRTRG
jgi:hypothetical protein